MYLLGILRTHGFFGTLVMASTLPTTNSPAHPVSRPGEPFWEIAYLYPTQGDWSEQDYLSLGTNHMVEFSDGCLEMLPMPTPFHQRIVHFLIRVFDAFVAANTAGELLFAPMPVRLWPGTFREPDIVYLRPDR